MGEQGNKISVVVLVSGGRWKHIRMAHTHHLLLDSETKWNRRGYIDTIARKHIVSQGTCTPSVGGL